ncbi:TrmH family RNA methyltransferase [Salaquimonas pukyongi]|uniref:TrmH family RNA methyltransferase n=1 Tax=Salaquimonas pukyongi TaxID=2712698 RepID=UPI00096BA8B0|nr:RNA methyltransferase [Salaquimonas pukyongi]
MADAAVKTAGKVKSVTSTANPLVKQIKALAMKKNRDREGVFLAEGRKLLTDAMEQGWQIETVVCSSEMAADPGFAATAARCRATGADILEVNGKVLGAISRRDNPQTVIAVIRQRWKEANHIAGSLKAPGDIVIALDRVRDPGNLGTIIRAADAAGAKGILLIGECTDPFSLEAVRATMGSLFHVPIARLSEDEFVAMALKAAGGVQIAGTHLQGAVDYRSIAWQEKPVILVMGNEQQGLTTNLAGACDKLVFIPMAGQADSLNLAVATGIVLFEARRDNLVMRTIEGAEGVSSA